MGKEALSWYCGISLRGAAAAGFPLGVAATGARSPMTYSSSYKLSPGDFFPKSHYHSNREMRIAIIVTR